jgi:hypothetical protein
MALGGPGISTVQGRAMPCPSESNSPNRPALEINTAPPGRPGISLLRSPKNLTALRIHS